MMFVEKRIWIFERINLMINIFLNLIINLMTLEDKISKEENANVKFQMKEHQKIIKEPEAAAPKAKMTSFSSAMNNIKNVAKNAYANTIGLPFALYLIPPISKIQNSFPQSHLKYQVKDSAFAFSNVAEDTKNLNIF